MRLPSASFLFALTLLAGAPAAAQNLLQYSTFVNGQGFIGWDMDASVGQWLVAQDSSHCDGSRAAYGTSLPVGGEERVSLVSDFCIPIDAVALPQLHLAALYGSDHLLYAALRVDFFDDEECTQPIAGSFGVYGVEPNGWEGLQGAVTVPGAASGFVFRFTAQEQSPGQGMITVGIDELYAGPPHPVFANGFERESGSFCGWIGVQPPPD